MTPAKSHYTKRHLWSVSIPIEPHNGIKYYLCSILETHQHKAIEKAQQAARLSGYFPDHSRHSSASIIR